MITLCDKCGVNVMEIGFKDNFEGRDLFTGLCSGCFNEELEFIKKLYHNDTWIYLEVPMRWITLSDYSKEYPRFAKFTVKQYLQNYTEVIKWKI